MHIPFTLKSSFLLFAYLSNNQKYNKISNDGITCKTHQHTNNPLTAGDFLHYNGGCNRFPWYFLSRKPRIRILPGMP